MIIEGLRSKIKSDETTIQNLQKEIMSLKMGKEDNKGLSLADKLTKAEEKIKRFTEMCSMLLFNTKNSVFDSFEEFIGQVRTTFEWKLKELDQTKRNNEELMSKLSSNEDKLITVNKQN